MFKKIEAECQKKEISSAILWKIEYEYSQFNAFILNGQPEYSESEIEEQKVFLVARIITEIVLFPEQFPDEFVFLMFKHLDYIDDFYERSLDFLCNFDENSLTNSYVRIVEKERNKFLKDFNLFSKCKRWGIELEDMGKFVTHEEIEKLESSKKKTRSFHI